MENTPSFNLAKVINDAISVIQNPVGFYQKMAKSGGYAEPVIFVIVMAVITGIIFGILSIVTGIPIVAALGMLIVMPLFVVIGSFISAAIFFVIWKLMGSEYNYEMAYRCIAYSMALMPIMAVLSFIPYAAIIGTLWAMYLLFVASTEAHGLNRNTAMIVCGVLAALGVISNIAGERAQQQLSGLQSQLEEATGGLGGLEGLEDMSPEEMGEALGGFLKGLEDAAGE